MRNFTIRSLLHSIKTVQKKSSNVISLKQPCNCICKRDISSFQKFTSYTATLKWKNTDNTIYFRIYSTKINDEKNEKNNDDPENKEWENFLDNEDKKNNISKIPTVKENIFTVPNLISLSRIIVTPYISYLIIDQQYSLALGFFVVAGISDMLDGQIARIWPSQQSAVGTALDPLGDKILVTALTISLTFVGILPGILTALIVSRDIGLVIAVFYLRYRTCPPPLTLKRYFDPTLVNAKLNPTTISKVNTVFQMAAISASMCAPVWEFVGHPLLMSLYAITAATTVWSGAGYIFNKDTVRIVKSSKT